MCISYVCHCDRLDDLFVVDMQFVTGYENPTIVYIAEVGLISVHRYLNSCTCKFVKGITFAFLFFKN